MFPCRVWGRPTDSSTWRSMARCAGMDRRLENDILENDGCFVSRLSATFQSIMFRILKLFPPFSSNSNRRLSVVCFGHFQVQHFFAAQKLRTHSQQNIKVRCAASLKRILVQFMCRRTDGRTPDRYIDLHAPHTLRAVSTRISVCFYSLCVLTLISKLRTSCCINCCTCMN